MVKLPIKIVSILGGILFLAGWVYLYRGAKLSPDDLSDYISSQYMFIAAIAGSLSLIASMIWYMRAMQQINASALTPAKQWLRKGPLLLAIIAYICIVVISATVVIAIRIAG